MNLRVKQNPTLNCLTWAQLQEIAGNLVVDLPCNTKLVMFSDRAPSDTTLPWQQTDGCLPVGPVKYFQNGQWK